MWRACLLWDRVSNLLYLKPLQFFCKSPLYKGIVEDFIGRNNFDTQLHFFYYYNTLIYYYLH